MSHNCSFSQLQLFFCSIPPKVAEPPLNARRTIKFVQPYELNRLKKSADDVEKQHDALHKNSTPVRMPLGAVLDDHKGPSEQEVCAFLDEELTLLQKK